jgi:Uma2 family endonuclease
MSIPTTTRPAPPPLKDGDRLTREEFERRYDTMPEVKKAELIEGVVHMPSPVRQVQHGGPHFDLVGWLALYRASTPGVEGGDNCSIRLGEDSMPQSDVALFLLPSHGGQARLTPDGYIEGGPELIIEVSATSDRLDRGAKLRLYRDSGVREYLVWLAPQGRAEWHTLEGGEYAALPPSADGLLRSRVFPGLWLDAEALARRDLARVLAVQQAGLASPEHAAFVAELARRAAG